MITLLPNNVQKSKKSIAFFAFVFMAEMMPSYATFIAEAILMHKWCIPIKWRPKGCQQQLIWICFVPILSPVLFCVLSYGVAIKQGIGEEIWTQRNPIQWLNSLPMVPPCLFSSWGLIIGQMIFCYCCSICQEGLTTPDYLRFTCQRVLEGSGEPAALHRLQSRLFQAVLWSPQQALTALWAQLVELRKVH